MDRYDEHEQEELSMFMNMNKKNCSYSSYRFSTKNTMNKKHEELKEE